MTTATASARSRPRAPAGSQDPAAPRAQAALQVSVVMPTHKRPDLLDRCLGAVLAQAFDRHVYEVVVVDDAPGDDGTPSEARTLVEAVARQAAASGGPVVRYVPNTGPAHGPAAARNRGWQAARAPIVAFTDDDTQPEPQWLAQGLAAMVPGVDAAWGHVWMPIPAVPTDYERDAKGLEGAEFVTANCFVRRAALVRVGGFDERFRLAWREDSDLHFSLLSQGCTVVPAPAARVLHPVRPAPWGVSISQQKKAQYDALLARKHPALYRQRIPGTPWRYYATVAALGLGAVALAAGRPRAAGLAGAAWAGLTADFAARRLRGTSKAPSHVAEMVVTSAAIPPLSVFWRLAGALKFKVPFA